MRGKWMIAVILSLGWFSETLGQYGSQYSLYIHERYAFNPAFGGMERSLSSALQYRSQWAGIEGNPESTLLNAHLPFYLWHGGIGFQLQSESIGAEKHTAFMMSYNYVHEAQIGLFSAGLRAGISQKSIDGTKLKAPDGTYEGVIIDHHDVNLPNGVVSGISPVFDGGVYYVGDYFESGISVTGYYPGGITLGDDIHYNPKPSFHLFGEYYLNVFEEVSLYPVMYIKSDLVETQAEVSIRGDWNNIVTAGIGYRGFGQNNLDALMLTAGVRLSPKFVLYYGYDIGLSSLQTSHDGSHELLIKYNLGKTIGAGLPPRIIYNPRNL